MALVTQVLCVCGLSYSRPPAAIRNPGHPPAAHLAPILERDARRARRMALESLPAAT